MLIKKEKKEKKEISSKSVKIEMKHNQTQMQNMTDAMSIAKEAKKKEKKR